MTTRPRYCRCVWRVFGFSADPGFLDVALGTADSLHRLSTGASLQAGCNSAGGGMVEAQISAAGAAHWLVLDCFGVVLEASPRIELGCKDLQSSA